MSRFVELTVRWNDDRHASAALRMETTGTLRAGNGVGSSRREREDYRRSCPDDALTALPK